MIAVTHSGKFHADDVLAWALILEFYNDQATLIRTRDHQKIQDGDIVFDVGGVFDPKNLRFDHHQSSYTGPLSSAGMVLSWLKDLDCINTELFTRLKNTLVDYVDDVDNGRVLPQINIPCFAQFVDILGATCNTLEQYDQAFQKATMFAQNYLRSITDKLVTEQKDQQQVLEEMHKAQSEKRNYLLFPKYTSWKVPYFSHNGSLHPTEFVMFPNLQNNWQAVAIPPEENSFAQKKSFPKEWAGLRDQDLAAVIGIPGGIFCHKNRFIAVFSSKESMMQSMKKWNLIS